MRALTPRKTIVIAIAALTSASASVAIPLKSARPSAHECIAGDRMPLPGCIVGEGARERAEGRWRSDPGMIIWDGTYSEQP
jgi:hypothetical protein